MNRKELAIQHTKVMAEQFPDSTALSIKYSKIYTNKVNFDHHTHIELVNKTTDCVVEDDDCVLNFASYKSPGGGFINGAMAQEEALCHASNLYNILKEFPEYYEWNQQHLNDHLYTNRAIFTPGVKMYNPELNYYCDVHVITCAAPNISFYTGNKAEEAMNERIKFILDIAEDNHCNKLVLGAFGCGVFKNDPYKVAQMFINNLKNHHYFDEIIFAIPAGPNYEAFEKVFKANGIIK